MPLHGHLAGRPYTGPLGAPLAGWIRHGRRQHTPVRAQYRQAKTQRACRHLSERTSHPCWVEPPLLGGAGMTTGSTRLCRCSTGEPRHHKPAGATMPASSTALIGHNTRPCQPPELARRYARPRSCSAPWSDTLAHLPKHSGWANDEPSCPALSVQQRLTPGLPCPALPCPAELPSVAWHLAGHRAAPAGRVRLNKIVAYNKHLKCSQDHT